MKQKAAPPNNMAGTQGAKLQVPAALHENLVKVLSVIQAHPGIRPSEINRLLKLEQSDGLRNTLIRRGLIRKEKHGSAVRYYAV
jgi:hypothetical protein